VSNTYQPLGTYTPSLPATDEGGASTTVQGPLITLTGNSAPQASFIANPKSGGTPLKVDFDATDSTDPDGDPLTYSWKFGDGGVGSGVQTSHTYQAIGVYTVELTVSDGVGIDTDTEIIEVKNQPPTINLAASPSSGTPPLEVTFDASASFDPEGGPLTYNWNFGDGTTIANGEAVVKHTYASIGSFTARLTLTDDKGESTLGVRTISITVPGNRPPNVSLGADPQSGAANLNVSFNLAGTSDPDGDPVQLTLDFGDGNVVVNLLPTSKVSHMYTNAGTYTVLAVGSDGKGATGQAQIQVQVTGGSSGGDSGAPSGNPCAAGIAQAMVFGLAGVSLLGVGSRIRRRRTVT
jgi:PKD repeat protein